MLLAALDILVFILGMTGAILLIYKNKLAFIAYAVHSFLWGILSIAVGNYWAALTCLAFIIIDLYAYWKWRKDDVEQSK